MPSWKKIISSGSDAALNSLNVTTNVTAQSFTGSLFGTSSWANNTVTASYVTSLRQNVYITGSFNVTGSTTQVGTNTLAGNTILSGSIIISGSTTSPATPTIKVYGDMETDGVIKFLPVVKNIDTSISASYVFVSGSTGDLYFSQNGLGYNNVTRLRWLEGNLYTGLLSGGVLSTTLGSTIFNISSGSGIIVNLNAFTSSVDPFPTIQYVTWPTYTNQSIINSGSAKITYVGINNTGAIVQQIVPWGSTDVNQWDTQIEVGTVLHLSGSVSTGVYNAPTTGYGVAQRTDDFLRAFGPLKISGHVLSPSGSSPTLSIIKTGGTAYNSGANYVNNPNHPSTVTDPVVNVSKIYRYYISGSTPIIDTGVGNAGYTAIDNTQYVNTATGALTSVGNGNWSIQRVFWFPNSTTNAFVVYYGNDRYSTLLNAVNAKDSEPFFEAPNTAQNAIFIGYIIIQGGSGRDLLNASETTIIQGGLFRNVGGIGSSGTSPVSTTLAGLSDVSIPGRTAGDLLYYNGSQWVNSKTLSGNYSITGSLNASGVFTGSFSGSVAAPGATTQVVYNNGGVLGANSGLVYSGSNVGIGTASPIEKLSLAGSTGTTFGLSLEPSGWNSAKHRFSVPISGDISMWSFNWNGTAVDSALYAPASILMAQGTITFNTTGSANSPAPRMIINSTGNVGIGITNPYGRLEIQQSSTYDGLYISNSTSARNAFGIWHTGGVGHIETTYLGGSGAYTPISIDTSGTSRIYIETGGNVGIGTTSPSYKLQVNGDGNGLYVIGANSSPYTQTIASFVYGGNSNSINIENQGGKASFQARDSSNNAMNLHLNPVGGNVGIGTTGPSQLLEVQGQAQIGNDNVASAGLFFARKNSNQAKSHYFLSAQESPTYQWIEGGYFTSELAGVSVANNSGKPYYESYSPAGQYKSFGFINQTTSGSSFTNTAVTASMVLYQGGNIALTPTQGNVGIGTTSPATALEVNGTITSTGVLTAYTSVPSINIGHDGSAAFIAATSGGGSNTPIYFSVGNNNEKMRITAAGNVGIGTSSPAKRLHVRDTTSPYQINLQSDTSKVWATGVGISGYYQDWFLLSDGTSDIFRINAGYTEITNNIYASANVGIGTASPSQKLDVAGAISVSGSVIDYESSAALIAGVTTTNVVSFIPGTTKAAFIDYMIIDSSTGTNQRVGTIMVSISLNTVSAVINEITTVDIGNTAAVRFGVSYGPPVQITATNSGITPYDIKYMVRYF